MLDKLIRALHLIPQRYTLQTLFYTHASLAGKTIPSDFFVVDKYPFLSLTKDEDGLSVVLSSPSSAEGVSSGDQSEIQVKRDASSSIPGLGQADKVYGPWRAIKIRGPLDFGLTGILNELTTPLKNAQISIYALSTWDTDYVLVPAATFEDALGILRKDDWVVADP